MYRHVFIIIKKFFKKSIHVITLYIMPMQVLKLYRTGMANYLNATCQKHLLCFRACHEKYYIFYIVSYSQDLYIILIFCVPWISRSWYRMYRI